MTVTFWEQLTDWYETNSLSFKRIPFVQRVWDQTLTKPNYVSFLQQYYHFVRTTPNVYALAASRMPPQYASAREWFFWGAYQEFGHDEFVVKDLVALGISEEEARLFQPSPEMDALLAYNYYFVERRHPIGILGLSFLMGQMSMSYSLEAAEKLQKSLGGISGGTSFFSSHGQIDKNQPQELSKVIQSIHDPIAQNYIFTNAKTVLMLYENFFRSLG